MLTWDAVVQSWYRMAHRVVLGEGAGNDTALEGHVARAEPGTLAAELDTIAWKDHVPAGVMEGGDGAPPFLPLSAGPAICPGRHVVLLTVSTALAHGCGSPGPDRARRGWL